MSKRPTDHLEPASKKRGNDRQLTKDDASDDEEYVEKGTMSMASDDVLKTRKIVKARRGTAAPPTTPASGVPSGSSNPFAGVNLLGASTPAQIFPSQVTAKPASIPKPAVAALESTPAPESVTAGQSDAHRSASVEAQDTTKPTTSQQGATAESSPDTAKEAPAKDSPMLGITAAKTTTSTPGQNGTAQATTFASFAGSSAPFASAGANKPLFNFGSLADGAASGEQDTNKPKPFSFGPLPATGGFAFQSTSGAFPSVPGMFGSKTAVPEEEGRGEDTAQQDDIKPALAVLPPETETVTGEEDETQLWAGEGTLYEFTPPQSWKERGKGEMRINKGTGKPARFVLRQKGHHRLLMNANLWPDMRVTKMDGGKGATFTVANGAAKGDSESDTASKDPKLQTFAFRVRSGAQMDAFIETVDLHKQTNA